GRADRRRPAHLGGVAPSHEQRFVLREVAFHEVQGGLSAHDAPSGACGAFPRGSLPAPARNRELAGARCAFWGVIMGRRANWRRRQVGDTGGTEGGVVEPEQAARGVVRPELAELGVPPDAVPWTPPTWDEVVRDHSARVYRLAYRLTGNVPDAEDLTQE